MSNMKCKNCGCSEIDVDPARGDAVCTNCGSVLEDSVIVSELQFEENAHGQSSALGQFVSSESKGGCGGFGGSFHAGLGRESREITLRNAKRAITHLAQQMRLNAHCIDTAFNFYKMALMRQLTRGRKNTHVVAACVYMTCRTEGTAHMLIDFSDVLQICVYELGRTYLRLSQALCINIPSMDPCLYILRFANRLEFGDKTHEVSMTALRLVSRMKRDYIHTGRRPSGLCGAALLIAARLHEFSRTVGDIIKIVKVHESTLRKRLVEFGETPSSSLTLDEFMSVDLEEEQDPPSFKNARKKDKERLQKMMDEEDVSSHFSELQREIEKQLEEKSMGKKRRKLLTAEETDKESQEAESFIVQSTLGTIEGCLASNTTQQIEEIPLTLNNPTASLGLGPNIASMGLASSLDDCKETAVPSKSTEETGEIDLDGLDDDEIDSYIMSENEAKYKDTLWMKINAVYLKEQKEKEEKLAKEKEEGKPEKKKRRTSRKPKSNLAANTPGEAIEKMLQEKKISSKINYDVLKSLNVKEVVASGAASPSKRPAEVPLTLEQSETRQSSELTLPKSEGSQPKLARMSRVTPQVKVPARKSKVDSVSEIPAVAEQTPAQTELEPDEGDEFEDEPEPEPDHNELSLTEMLNHHRDDDNYYGDDYYDDY